MLFKKLLLAGVLIFAFSFHSSSVSAQEETIDTSGSTLISAPVSIETASVLQGGDHLQFLANFQNNTSREVTVRIGAELRASNQKEDVAMTVFSEGASDAVVIPAGKSTKQEFLISTPILPVGQYQVYIGVVEDKATRLVTKKLVATLKLGSEHSVKVSDCTLGKQSLSDGLISVELDNNHLKGEVTCQVALHGGEEYSGKLLLRLKDRHFSVGRELASAETAFNLASNPVTLSFDVEAAPGSYDLEILPVNTDNQVVGAVSSARLVIAGSGGKILSFSNLAGKYMAGDEVVLESLTRRFSDGDATLRVELSAQGMPCAEVVELPVKEDLVKGSVKIAQNCENPTALVTLVASDGSVFDTFKQTFVTTTPREPVTDTSSMSSKQPQSFNWWMVIWFSPIVMLIAWLAVRRVRKAGVASVKTLFFLFFFLSVSFGLTGKAHAGSANFNLWYICVPGPGCPLATAVWYNFDTNKDVYAPGETITIWALLSSDDNPQTPLCPVVRIGINGSGYTGDLVPGCYSEQNFRDGVDLTFTMTAPATPGPFNLSFSVGLSGYAVPPVQHIPLTVSTPAPAPTVTLNPFSPSTITAGGTSSISFSSTDATSCTGSGIWNGNLGGTSTPSVSTPAMAAGTYTQSVTCSGPGGSATSVTRTLQVNPAVAPPTATISASGPVAFSEPHWWEKALSLITGADSVAHAGASAIITLGENAALTWSSTGATSCTISGNGISRIDLNFSNYRLTGLPTGVFTYNISCSNVAGTATDSTMITVNPPRIDGVCAPTHYNCIAGVTRLDGDTASDYRWTCLGSGGGLNSIQCLEAKSVPVPPIPDPLTATPGSCGTGAITLNWSNVGASSYQLRDGGTQIYSNTGTSFTHTGLTDGSSHSYTVRANSVSGSSAWSAPIIVNAPAACAGGAPGTPTSLTATPAACDTGTINITWANVGTATSYQLRDGGTQIYSGASSNFSHSSLTAGSSHSYTVRATNASGSSSWSGVVSANAPNACVTTTVNGVCGAAAETCAAGTYSNSPADTSTNYQWTCLGAGSPVGSNSGTCTAAIPTTYTITASAGSGGFISPSGSISGIVAGSSRTFTITENFPNVIDTVTVNTGSGPVNIGSPSSYTFSNINSNGSISVTFRAGTTSGITQAQGCAISAGNSTCTGRVSWTTAASAVAPIELSVSGTTFYSNNPAASNQSVSLDYGTHRVTLTDAGGLYETANMSAVCFGALLYSQGICQSSGGSISASPTNCSIPIGQSTCDVNFTWWTQNLTSASVYNASRGIVYSSALSGTNQPFPITFGNNTVRLRDAALATRDSVTVRGNCAGTWNAVSGICEAAGSPSAVITVGNCVIPVSGSTCNASISWTSSSLNSATPTMRQSGVVFSSAPIVLPAANMTRPLTFGSNMFRFIDGLNSNPMGTNILDTKFGTATCAGASIWNGTTCAAVCVPSDFCSNHTADTDNVCVGSQYIIANDGCGNSISCPGTRSCDYNWREVAP